MWKIGNGSGIIRHIVVEFNMIDGRNIDVKTKIDYYSRFSMCGKTTVTQKLFTSYENSAYFDGDWAWCVNPFSVDDPRLRNGDKTMSFALSTYLNSCFDYVFFSSVVVVDKTIREAILKDITAKDYSVIGITLTCSEQTLRERHKKRGDQNECSFFWLHLKPYKDDYVVNTDNKSVQQIVDEIKAIVDSEVNE